jgi:2-polyprenyl-3-methyl-5-hydroxy-6-metoxy-1,4-benzoquinol methylase
MGGEQALTAVTGAKDSEKERLEPADLEAGGLLAAVHIHRYEFAARLCAGRRVLDLCCGTGYGARILAREATAVHGVDVSEEALATARSELEDDERARISFERDDALAYLRRVPVGGFDAIVCLEGVEHVADPQALVGELVRLAEDGTELIISLPNSRGFEERNEFHVTDFGYEEMRAVADRFPDAVVLPQYLAEGSLILTRDAGRDSEAHGRVLDAGSPEASSEVWANHWLILVGVDLAQSEQAQAGLGFVAAPYHNQYMRQLERANAELLRANLRMGRAWLGVHDAAAGAAEARRVRLEARVAELEQIVLHHKTALEAPRYRAVDAVRTLAFSIPGVATLLRLRSSMIQRRSRTR